MMIRALSVSMMASFCMAGPSDRGLVVSVVHEARTGDILISLENVTAVDQEYYDSFSELHDMLEFVWCQFALRDNNGEIVRESKTMPLNYQSAFEIQIPATLSILRIGGKVTKLIPRDRLRDVVEDIILTCQEDCGSFNSIRFKASVFWDPQLSKFVSGESEYLDLANYLTDRHY